MRSRRAATATVASLALVALTGASAAAVGGTGLSISPPTVEHPARPGAVGAVTVTNGTGQAMRISVTAHPWTQLASGAAVPNPRLLLRSVRSSPATFTLANGASQVVSLALLTAPATGSLYGNVDVMGIPTTPSKAPNAVNFEYRLISALRLDPLHARLGARAGGVVVSGSRRHGAVALAIANTGNSIAPIGGSVTIRGARGAVSGSLPATRILPGATVDATVVDLDGSLPAGGYTLSVSLNQSGHRILTAKRAFKLH